MRGRALVLTVGAASAAWWAGTAHWPRFGGVVPVLVPGGAVLTVPVVVIAYLQLAMILGLVGARRVRGFHCPVSSAVAPATWATCLVGAAVQAFVGTLRDPSGPQPAVLAVTAGPAALAVVALATTQPVLRRPRISVHPVPAALGLLLLLIALAAARPEAGEGLAALVAIQIAFGVGLVGWLAADRLHGGAAALSRALPGGLVAAAVVVPGSADLSVLSAIAIGAAAAIVAWTVGFLVGGSAAGRPVPPVEGPDRAHRHADGCAVLVGAMLAAVHLVSLELTVTEGPAALRVTALGVHHFATTLLVGAFVYRLVGRTRRPAHGSTSRHTWFQSSRTLASTAST